MALEPSSKISALPPVVADDMVDADYLSGVFSGTTSRAALSELREKIGQGLAFAILPAEVGLVTAANSLYPYGDPRRFGALGNGSNDDFPAIQSALNVAAALSDSTVSAAVTLLSGRYSISDTLQMGLGASFSNVIFRGAGAKYRSALSFVGSAIIPTFSDARPCLNIQGLRMPLVEGIWFYNATGVAYSDAQGLGGASSLLDPSVAANWDYTSGVDTAFAPNAAISIDGYAGAEPATHYPTTGNTYGKSQTIKPRVRNCGFSGFIAGIVCQPSNADGNGDYLDVEDCWFEKGKWGISVGNSQSRAVNIQNCQFSFLYRWITNNQHGKKVGKFGGTIQNCAGFDCDGIYELGAATGGPIIFNTCYTESHRVIGNVVQNGSTIEYAYLHNGCEFKFHTQNDTWGHPQYILTGGNSGNFKFNGCTFSNYESVLGFQPPNTAFDDCQFRPNSARTNDYEKFAHNALAGGLVAFRLRLNGLARLKSKFYNLDTGTATVTPLMTDKFACDRTNCIPLYGNRIMASGAVVWDDLPNPHSYQLTAGSTSGVVISKTSGGTTVTFGSGATGREMTIVFGARTDSTFLAFGPLTGDVIYDDATGTVFFVRSRTTTTVIAVAQNNYKSDGAGGYQLITAVSTTVGAMYVGNSRLYTPAKYLQGTLTAATAAVASVGNSAGTAAFDVDIAAGDLIMVWSDIDAWAALASAVISARSQATTSITLTAGTGVKAGTRRFPYLARVGPANA